MEERRILRIFFVFSSTLATDGLGLGLAQDPRNTALALKNSVVGNEMCSRSLCPIPYTKNMIFNTRISIQ
jgi:hypothetical protein